MKYQMTRNKKRVYIKIILNCLQIKIISSIIINNKEVIPRRYRII